MSLNHRAKALKVDARSAESDAQQAFLIKTTFFKKNLVLLTAYFPRKDGTQQLFTPLVGGVGLGDYHKDADICEFKTFVDNSLLGQNQQQAILSIWTDTLKEMTAEMQRRIDKRAASKKQMPKG